MWVALFDAAGGFDLETTHEGLFRVSLVVSCLASYFCLLFPFIWLGAIVDVHCGIITGSPDSAGGSSLNFEFIRECMRINKIRPKFFKMALEAKKQ